MKLPSAKETTEKLVKLWMNRTEVSERLTVDEAELLWIKVKEAKGLSLTPEEEQTYSQYIKNLFYEKDLNPYSFPPLSNGMIGQALEEPSAYKMEDFITLWKNHPEKDKQLSSAEEALLRAKIVQLKGLSTNVAEEQSYREYVQNLFHQKDVNGHSFMPDVAFQTVAHFVKRPPYIKPDLDRWIASWKKLEKPSERITDAEAQLLLDKAKKLKGLSFSPVEKQDYSEYMNNLFYEKGLTSASFTPLFNSASFVRLLAVAPVTDTLLIKVVTAWKARPAESERITDDELKILMQKVQQERKAIARGHIWSSEEEVQMFNALTRVTPPEKITGQAVKEEPQEIPAAVPPVHLIANVPDTQVPEHHTLHEWSALYAARLRQAPDVQIKKMLVEQLLQHCLESCPLLDLNIALATGCKETDIANFRQGKGDAFELFQGNPRSALMFSQTFLNFSGLTDAGARHVLQQELYANLIGSDIPAVAEQPELPAIPATTTTHRVPVQPLLANDQPLLPAMIKDFEAMALKKRHTAHSLKVTILVDNLDPEHAAYQVNCNDAGGVGVYTKHYVPPAHESDALEVFTGFLKENGVKEKNIQTLFKNAKGKYRTHEQLEKGMAEKSASEGYVFTAEELEAARDRDAVNDNSGRIGNFVADYEASKKRGPKQKGGHP